MTLTNREFVELNTTLREGLSLYLTYKPRPQWTTVLFVVTTNRNRQGFLSGGDTISQMLDEVRGVASHLQDTKIEYAAIAQISVVTRVNRAGKETSLTTPSDVLRVASLSMDGHRADWAAQITLLDGERIKIEGWIEGEPVTQPILESLYTYHQELNPPSKSRRSWRPDEPTHV